MTLVMARAARQRRSSCAPHRRRCIVGDPIATARTRIHDTSTAAWTAAAAVNHYPSCDFFKNTQHDSTQQLIAHLLSVVCLCVVNHSKSGVSHVRHVYVYIRDRSPQPTVHHMSVHVQMSICPYVHVACGIAIAIATRHKGGAGHAGGHCLVGVRESVGVGRGRRVMFA
jgi:hypothetical protein